MAENSHLRIIAFEKDAHPLMGIYRPLYRRGDRVFRTEAESHDKEWFQNEARAGRIVPLEHPINYPPRGSLLMCLPKADADTLAFLPLLPQEKHGIAIACLDPSLCHFSTLWPCINKIPRGNQGLAKRIYAMMFACHVLKHGVTERLDALVTTVYSHPLKGDHAALAETWTLAKRFVLRFGKTLPDYPPLTTERLSMLPAPA